jgi:hypothetical protein
MIGKKEFWKSLPDMFRAAGKESNYHEIQQSIRNNEYYPLAKQDGVSFTDLEELSHREEPYQSRLAEDIPIVGKVVRGSERAYTAFANKLRMDTYASLMKDAGDLKLNPEQNVMLRKQIAKFINTATGRGPLSIGSLGTKEFNEGLEASGPMLNAVFFSPRLISSRLHMIGKGLDPRTWAAANPMTYMTADKFVRQQYLKSWLSFLGAGSTMMGLYSLIPGATINKDPNNSDFGKVKIGRTRIDVWGGEQQYVTLLSRLISGKETSPITGKTTKLNTGRFGAPDKMDVAIKFGRSKLSPFASFFWDVMSSRNFAGQPTTVPSALWERFHPMVTQDLWDLYKQDPRMTPLIAGGIFGQGVQTYNPNPFNRKGSSQRSIGNRAIK